MFLGIWLRLGADSDFKESCRTRKVNDTEAFQPRLTEKNDYNTIFSYILELTKSLEQILQFKTILESNLVKQISHGSRWWNPLICCKMKFLRYSNMFLGIAEYSNIPFTFEDLEKGYYFVS